MSDGVAAAAGGSSGGAAMASIGAAGGAAPAGAVGGASAAASISFTGPAALPPAFTLDIGNKGSSNAMPFFGDYGMGTKAIQDMTDAINRQNAAKNSPFMDAITLLMLKQQAGQH